MDPRRGNLLKDELFPQKATFSGLFFAIFFVSKPHVSLIIDKKVVVDTAGAHHKVSSEDHFLPGSMLLLMLMVVIVAVVAVQMIVAQIVLADSVYLFQTMH